MLQLRCWVFQNFSTSYWGGAKVLSGNLVLILA